MASQQTNFDLVLEWVARARYMSVCISLHLPRSQVIEIEALLIWKDFDHQRGIDVDGENPASCRKPRFRGA